MATTTVAFFTLWLLLLLAAAETNSGTGTHTQRAEIVLRERRSDELAALRTLVEQQAAKLQELQVLVLTLKGKAANEAVVMEQQAQLIQSVRAEVVSHSFTLAEMSQGGSHASDNGNAPSSQTSSTSAQAVAFTVKFSTNSSNNGIAVSNQSVLQFDEVASNSGKGYDINSGKFTAPVAGDYAFFLTTAAGSSHGPAELAIVKGSLVLGEVYASEPQPTRHQGSTLVTTHLAGGEQVWVRQQSGDSVGGGFWTVFTGFLLHAD